MDDLTGPDQDVTVEVTIEGADRAVITVVGEIDITTVGHIRSAVAQAVELHATGIVFDLSGVGFMDSSGIAVLIEARVAAATIALRRPSLPVQRVLAASGLTETLTVEP